MGLNVYIDEIEIQKQYAESIGLTYRGYVSRITTTIEGFLYTPYLTGKAYESMKQYIGSVYLPLAKGLDLISVELMDAHYDYLNQYKSNVSSGTIEEDKIQKIINAQDSIILRYQEATNKLENSEKGLHDVSMIFHQDFKKILVELLEKLYSFHSISPSFFLVVEQLLTDVEKGLTAIEAVQSQRASLGLKGLDLSKIDLTWAVGLNEAWENNNKKYSKMEEELVIEKAKIDKELEDRVLSTIEITEGGGTISMFVQNPPKANASDFQLSKRLGEYIKKYGKFLSLNASSLRGNTVDPMAILAIEASTGVEYKTGRNLTDTEVLQRQAAGLSMIANMSIGVYWGSKYDKSNEEKYYKEGQGKVVKELAKNKINSSDIKFGSDTKSSGKLSNQMNSRGWSKESAKSTIDNPYLTRPSINLATGNEATVFYQQNGAYIIVDNITLEIVQVSNALDPFNWIPDKNITNPYLPKNKGEIDGNSQKIK